MIPTSFTSGDDRVRGRFYLATGEAPFLTVLLLQGLPGYEEDVLGLGQRLSQAGINALTFNYRGTFQSEGEYSLAATLEDIRAAIAYLGRADIMREFQIDREGVVLGGYSYGGGMAMSYAADHPEIRRVFAVAGTDHSELAREYRRNPAFASMVDAMFEEQGAPVGPLRYAEPPMVELLRNPDPYDLRLLAPALADRDLLIIGGWDDAQVTIENHVLPFYRALMAAEARALRIMAFQDDHGFENSREELAAVVIRWVCDS